MEKEIMPGSEIFVWWKNCSSPRATGRLRRREKFEPKFVKWGHIKISNNVKDLKDRNSLLYCSTFGSVDVLRIGFLHVCHSLCCLCSAWHSWCPSANTTIHRVSSASPASSLYSPSTQYQSLVLLTPLLCETTGSCPGLVTGLQLGSEKSWEKEYL